MNNLYIQKVLVIVGVLEDYMLLKEKFEEIGIGIKPLEKLLQIIMI